MVANNAKIYLKMKKTNKPLLSIEKNEKKILIIIIRNYLFGWRISGCFEDINLLQIAYLKKIVLKSKADLNGKKVETYELKTIIRKSKNG